MILDYIEKNDIVERVLNREAHIMELNDLDEPVRSALHSFLVDLESYCEATKGSERPIEIERLFIDSIEMGPKYAKYVDGLKSFIASQKLGWIFLDPEIDNTYRGFKIPADLDSVGAIYRGNLLFAWTPPNIEGFEEIVMEPVVELEDNNRVDIFKNAVLRVLNQEKLKKNFVPENNWRMFDTDSAKGSLDGKQGRLPPIKEPASKRGKSQLVFAPREKKESRAACLEEQSSVVRIRWIESNIQRLLENEPRSVTGLTRQQLTHRLLGGVAKSTINENWTPDQPRRMRWTYVPLFSYCRDFKKEGLTKPRKLVRAMLEALNETFPDADAFKSVGFFDVWELKLPPTKDELTGENVVKTIFPARGHGLGMGNALTTLMQLAIEEINTNECGVRPEFSGYDNDDAATSFKTEADRNKYLEKDKETCRNLSLKYKTKATFIATGSMVLCEAYVSTKLRYFNDKTSHGYAELYNVLKCVNTSHARSLVCSMNLRQVPQCTIERIHAYWGYVLYRNEHMRPDILGGWYKMNVSGVDTSFINRITSEPLNKMEDAARWAYENSKFEPVPWKKGKKAFLHKSKAAHYYGDAFCNLKGMKTSIEEKDLFSGQRDPYENTRAWTSYEKTLLKNFSIACSWRGKVATWGEIYQEESKRRIKEDIIPPIGAREEVPSTEHVMDTNIRFEHIYGALDLGSELDIFWRDSCDNSYPLQLSRSGGITLGFEKTERENLEERKKALLERSGLDIKVFDLFLLPSEKSMKYWHDPFTVCKVFDSLAKGWHTVIPSEPIPDKMLLLESRAKYYGRELTPKEWLLIGSIKKSDQIFIYKTKSFWSSGWINKLEDYVQFARNFPGIGRKSLGMNSSTRGGRRQDVISLMRKHLKDNSKIHTVEQKPLKFLEVTMSQETRDMLYIADHFEFDQEDEIKLTDSEENELTLDDVLNSVEYVNTAEEDEPPDDYEEVTIIEKNPWDSDSDYYDEEVHHSDSGFAEGEDQTDE